MNQVTMWQSDGGRIFPTAAEAAEDEAKDRVKWLFSNVDGMDEASRDIAIDYALENAELFRDALSALIHARAGE